MAMVKHTDDVNKLNINFGRFAMSTFFIGVSYNMTGDVKRIHPFQE